MTFSSKSTEKWARMGGTGPLSLPDAVKAPKAPQPAAAEETPERTDEAAPEAP